MSKRLFRNLRNDCLFPAALNDENELWPRIKVIVIYNKLEVLERALGDVLSVGIGVRPCRACVWRMQIKPARVFREKSQHMLYGVEHLRELRRAFQLVPFRHCNEADQLVPIIERIAVAHEH